MAGRGGSPLKTVEAETTNTLLPPKDGSDFALRKKSKRRPPPTAFYIFMNRFRQDYEEENRYVNLKDVPKLGGEKWKSLTEDEKKIYRDRAARLLEKYNQSLENDDSDDEEEDEETDDSEEDEFENKEYEQWLSNRKK